MTKVIFWNRNDGSCIGYTPPDGLTLEEVLASDAVPQDRPVFAIERSAIPTASHPSHLQLSPEGVLTVDDLPRVKAAKQDAIIAAFEARIAAGLPYAGKVVQIREADRNVITAVFGRATAHLSQQVAPIPDVDITWPEGGYPWRMLDDTYLPLSAIAFVDMAQRVADYYGALFYVSRALKDAIAAAQTAQAVTAIDVDSGWPEV